jgi:hypothetical protein
MWLWSIFAFQEPYTSIKLLDIHQFKKIRNKKQTTRIHLNRCNS